MVGDRHGIHPELLDPGHQTVDPVGAVEQAVLGVQMKVNEGGAHGVNDTAAPTSRATLA